MKKIILYFLSSAILMGAASGCATSADIERVERQTATINAAMREIKGNLDEINFSLQAQAKRSKESADALNAVNEGQARTADAIRAMTEEMEVIKRNQAELSSRVFSSGATQPEAGRLDELRHEIAETNSKLDALKAALLQRFSELEKARPPQGGGEAAQGTAGEAAAGGSAPAGDPNQVYQAAYLDYTKGNYDLSIEGFREYLRDFPDAEFAGNAQYWIAESLYSLKKYEQALPEFQKVIDGYPKSQKVPGALLKLGYTYDALKRPKEAKGAYEELIKKFPASEAAKLAEERLKKK